MVTCQSSELGWEGTIELPADFLSLGRGSVKFKMNYNMNKLKLTHVELMHEIESAERSLMKLGSA